MPHRKRWGDRFWKWIVGRRYRQPIVFYSGILAMMLWAFVGKQLIFSGHEVVAFWWTLLGFTILCGAVVAWLVVASTHERHPD